jgi:hypothetical protein
MRKLLVTFLTVLLALGSFLSPTLEVKANQQDKFDVESLYYDEELGGYITFIYEVTEDGYVEVPIEEYIKEKERRIKVEKEWEEQKEKNKEESLEKKRSGKGSVKASSTTFSYYYKYKESKSSLGLSALSYAVSNPYSCPTNAKSDCTETVQWSGSRSETFDSSVEIGWKDYIRTSAGFSWNKSLTVSSSYTLPIPPGKTGQLKFAPKYNKTTGYVTKYAVNGYGGSYKISETLVSATSPQKLYTGELAGHVFGVIW